MYNCHFYLQFKANFSAIFWTSDLASYASKLKNDDVPFLTLSWSDDKSKSYWSIVFQAPHTQVVVELVGSDSPTEIVANVVNDPLVRITSQIFSDNGADSSTSSKILVPLAVSKGTSNMTAISDFYENALFAKSTYSKTFADGAKVIFYNPGF